MGTDFLHGIETEEIDNGTRPIRTVKSSIIGLIGTAAQGPVNFPVLIKGSRKEGVRIFGPADGLGTIPDALDGIFDQAGAMVVVINVCDPAIHKTAVPEAAYAFSEAGEILLPHRHVSAVTVKSADGATTHAADADYLLDPVSGKLSRKAGGAIAAKATVKIAFTHVDPTKVTLSDVIGAATDTGFTGVHALRAAQSTVFVTPRILIAPGFTSVRPDDPFNAGMKLANPVVAELAGLAPRLRAVIIADGPNGTDEEAVAYRKDWGTPRIYVVDPHVVVWDIVSNGPKIQPPSARVAGLIARMDSDKGFWWSPSNQILEGVIGLARPIDFSISDPNCVANYLNENEVATIVNDDGFRLWGNRTTAIDPLWAFLSVRRTHDMVYESIENAMRWAMDRPFSRQLVEDIADSVNAYLKLLTARGALLGGKVWLDPELNTKEVLQSGQLFVDYDNEAPAPLERLTFRAHRNNGYYEEMLLPLTQPVA